MCIKSDFKAILLKSDFKEIYLKLATNRQSDKAFLLTSNFVSKGLSAPALGLYTSFKSLKICIKSDFKEIFFKNLQQMGKVIRPFC